VICNNCGVVIGQDTGKQDDLVQIINRTETHIGTPQFLTATPTEHEILTIDVLGRKYEKGLKLTKKYSD
jgi:hypothetical protein